MKEAAESPDRPTSIKMLHYYKDVLLDFAFWKRQRQPTALPERLGRSDEHIA